MENNPLNDLLPLTPHKRKGNKTKRYQKPQSVKNLESLLLEAKRVKFPSIPPDYLHINPLNDNTANGLTRCIISFVRLMGGQAERISITGRAIDRTKTFTDVTGRTRTIGTMTWIKGNTTKGSADISATIKGQSVKIEVKIGSDRQSAAQMDYQKSIEDAGGLYVIAKDFSSFEHWYNETFEPQP